MTERSRPWADTAPGDSGPYTDENWSDVWAGVFGPVVAREGVFAAQADILTPLDLSSVAATPVSIAPGQAMVDGTWYENTTSVTKAISTPAVNPRVDRILLRKDSVLQTVRIEVKEGAEAASPVPPALTQTVDVTWELPLWQIFVTTGGVITFFRDERSFIDQYTPVGITDEQVYLEQEFFLPSVAMTTGLTIGSFGIIIVANGTINSLAASGRGAATLRMTGAGATNVVDIRSRDHRPDLIDGHLVMGAKQPNTDAELDRVLGFLDSAISLTPTNGVFFRANGTANWFAVCRSGGVETAVDTGQALDDVMRKFETRQNGQNVVTFLIDDAVVATIQTNISAAELMLRLAIFDSGAGTAGANDYMDVDRFKLTGPR